MALTGIQQSIYDKINTWTMYSHGVGGHLVSANYYYSWLIRTKLADIDTLNTELRKMVDDGVIIARTVRIAAQSPAQLYDTNQDQQTATILSLPETEVNGIIAKYAKTHSKTTK